MKIDFLFASILLFRSSVSAHPTSQEDVSVDAHQPNSAFKRHFRRVTPYILSSLFTTPHGQHEPPTNQLNVIVISHQLIKTETFREFFDGLDEQYQSSKTFLKEIVEDFNTPVDIYTSPLISMDDVDVLNISNVNEVYEDARLFEKNTEKSDVSQSDDLHSFLQKKAQEILNVQSFHQSILLEWAERNHDEMNVIILASPLWSLLWQTISCKKPISDIDPHHHPLTHESRISIKFFQRRKGKHAFQ